MFVLWVKVLRTAIFTARHTPHDATRNHVFGSNFMPPKRAGRSRQRVLVSTPENGAGTALQKVPDRAYGRDLSTRMRV